MYQENNNTNKYFTLGQVQLLNSLRKLWIDHINWTRSFIISSVFNLKDLEFVTQRLLRNPADFAEILSKFYGDQKSMEFAKLLTDHLLIAAQIVNASKSGDTKTAEEQREKWFENANDIIDFLIEINPDWNKDEWKSLFYEHLEMTENEVALLLKGQYADSISLFDSIQDQALKMADYMTYGIIQQFNI